MDKPSALPFPVKQDTSGDFDLYSKGSVTAYCETMKAITEACIFTPVPMLLWCPECGERHIDVGEFAKKVHHTHACQSCGMVWRPAVIATVGVTWLPGFKNGT